MSELKPNCFGLGIGYNEAKFSCECCEVKNECESTSEMKR